MPYNPEPLVQAIEKIRKRPKNAGKVIELSEMADKVGVSLDEFQAYLSGEAEIPSGLPYRLRSAYGMGVSNVTITSSVKSREFKPYYEMTEEERQQTNYTSLTAILSSRKKLAQDQGLEITEEELAARAGITEVQLSAYLNREVPIPMELINKLNTSTRDILDAAIAKQNRNNLKHAIPQIRNRALAKDLDITLGDMLFHIGLSNEELYAYLSGEQNASEDYSAKLRLAYPDMDGSGKTEIREELFLDDLNKTVRLV
jgi:plasmid maintenance system antidote protein VapI